MWVGTCANDHDRTLRDHRSQRFRTSFCWNARFAATWKSSHQTRGGVLASTRSWRPSVTGPGATHKRGSWSATSRATGAMVRCRTSAMITTICSRTRQSAARIASMAKVTWERRSSSLPIDGCMRWSGCCWPMAFIFQEWTPWATCFVLVLVRGPNVLFVLVPSPQYVPVEKGPHQCMAEQ